MRRFSAILAALAMLSGISAGAETRLEKAYIITSPYENTDWGLQYKSALHNHTNNSFDGKDTLEDMVAAHYYRGFSIIAITDHNKVTPIPDSPMFDGKMMIIPNCCEQSATEHINTFWTDYANTAKGRMTADEKMEETIGITEEHGGISVINHPGRNADRTLYGLPKDEDDGVRGGVDLANTPEFIERYVNFFMKYPSCIGMEAVNRQIYYSEPFLTLWDNVLMRTMPSDRPVYGFASDDSHAVNHMGYSYVIMLLPEFTLESLRTAMETGSFYFVSVISRDDISADSPLNSTEPRITGAETTPNTITVSGLNYDYAEWYADGVKIAEGDTLRLNEHEGEINSYVRAQLVSGNGTAFTQPFGIKENGYITIEETSAATTTAVSETAAAATTTAAVSATSAFDINENNQNDISAGESRGLPADNYILPITGAAVLVLLLLFAVLKKGK